MASWARSFKVLFVVVVVGVTGVMAPLARAATLDSRDDVYTVTGGNSLVVQAAHTFDAAWGSEGTGDGQFEDPYRIAVDSLGNTYVTDAIGDRVQKFASDGSFIMDWGTTGTGDGQFSYPFGIAVDDSGYVYVVDSWNHRVQKFTSDGTFVDKWGIWGSADGELIHPEGIVMGNLGYLYVVDTANSRIQKFTTSGVHRGTWGSMGTGDGQFQRPYGVAVDSEDNVYVTDRDNHQVQKFTSDGAFIRKWGSQGSGEGQLNLPNDIAVDATDTVYVVDGSNHRVQKFSEDGEFLSSWGGPGLGDGQLEGASGIAIDDTQQVYVTDLVTHRVQRFTAAGVLGNDYADTGSMTAEVYDNPIHGELALASDGSFTYTPDLGFHGTDTFTYRAVIDDIASSAEVTITVLEGANSPPLVLDDTYKVGRNETLDVPAFHEFEMKWTVCPPSDGMTSSVAGVVVDTDDNVYTAGFDAVIRKFTSDGELLASWGSKGSGDGEFDYPHEMAFAANGDIYITEYNNNRVQRFTSDGAFVGSWGGPGSGDGEFDGATGIAVAPNGDVFVADAGNARVQRFTGGGAYLSQWGTQGGRAGELSGPWGLSIDSAGNLYVANNSGRMQKWTLDGTLITDWGEYGSGPGQSSAWSSIALENDDVLFANDSENARIQKFTTYGRYIGEWGSWGTADHQFNSASGVAVDSYGRVYVGEWRLCTLKRFSAAGVLGNDIEPEAGTMGAAVVTGPSHGVLTLSPDGAFVYEPEQDWIGTDTFTYTVSDGALSTEGEVTIEVLHRGRFADDDGSIFENDIEWLAEKEITLGCNPPANDQFCPDQVVTRGQMAAFLGRALDLPDAGSGDPFVDDDGSVFEAHIARLAAAGITRGCNPPDNTMFCPNDSVTRGQMAAFVVRAMGYSDDGGGDLFGDDDGSVFEASIDKLAFAGVTRGCNPPINDRFCPDDYVTRGQMAAFLHRALGEQ